MTWPLKGRLQSSICRRCSWHRRCCTNGSPRWRHSRTCRASEGPSRISWGMWRDPLTFEMTSGRLAATMLPAPTRDRSTPLRRGTAPSPASVISSRLRRRARSPRVSLKPNTSTTGTFRSCPKMVDTLQHKRFPRHGTHIQSWWWISSNQRLMMKEGERKLDLHLLHLLLNQRHVQPPPGAALPPQLERLGVLQNHLRRRDQNHLITLQTGWSQSRLSDTNCSHHPVPITEERCFLHRHGWMTTMLFCFQSSKAQQLLEVTFQAGHNICVELQHTVSVYATTTL